MLLAYIHRSITHRVHFLDKARRDLFICAKDLFVAATWRPTHTWGRCLQAQHSKAVARRVTAMPEVLPVQFKQMLCSNGIKLLRDLAIADECNSNHKQGCANNPQSEEPTSPVHCSTYCMPGADQRSRWLNWNDRTQLKLKYSHHQQPQQYRHYD
jgi:hypothetical protein